MRTAGRNSANTQIAFVDLMLCSVGCALIVFVALTQQPHVQGGGWHDRPLIVQARFRPGPLYEGLRCRWSLQRSGSADVDDPSRARPELFPARGETAGEGPVLALAPEAEFGEWTLSVVARAPRSGLRELLARLAGRAEDDGAGHPSLEDVYRKFVPLSAKTARTLSLADPPRPAVTSLLRETQALVIPAAGVGAFGGGGTVGDDVLRYLRCRRWSMIARLADSLGTGFEGVRGEALNDWRADVDVPEGRDFGASDRALTVALRFALEAAEDRTGRAPLASEPALNAAQADRNVGMTGATFTPGYLAWRNELVRILVSAELRRASAHENPAAQAAALEAVVAMGNGDPVYRFLAAELKSLGEESRLVGTIEVRWGDRPAPGQTASARRPAAPVTRFSLAPAELGVEAVVATVVLDRDADGPVVAAPRGSSAPRTE